MMIPNDVTIHCFAGFPEHFILIGFFAGIIVGAIIMLVGLTYKK